LVSIGSANQAASSSANTTPVKQTSPSSITKVIGVRRWPLQGPMKHSPVSGSNWAWWLPQVMKFSSSSRNWPGVVSRRYP